MMRHTPAGSDKRLTRTCEFQKVYTCGNAVNRRFLKAYILPTTLGSARIGISISKKTQKNATDRNRVRRIIREGFKQALITASNASSDIVLVLKKPTSGDRSASIAIRAEISDIMRATRKCAQIPR